MVRISAFSKKSNEGTQPKWHVKDKWYKADDWGYEGIAETVCCDILGRSNIRYFAKYRPEFIAVGLRKFTGCESDDFLDRESGERLVHTNDILDSFETDLASLVYESENADAAIRKYLYLVHEVTHLDYSTDLCKILEFDDLVMDNDRNGGNMSFIRMSNGIYHPILFDNGRAFNTRDLKLNPDRDPAWRARTTRSIPFSIEPHVQVRAIEKLCGGVQLKINYGLGDLEKSLERCRKVYPKKVIDGLRKSVISQMLTHQKYLSENVKEELKEFKVPMRYMDEEHHLISQIEDEDFEKRHQQIVEDVDELLDDDNFLDMESGDKGF